MKKQILKLAVLLAMPVIVLQSCSKDEESKNTATVNMGSATITGRLVGDIVLNNGQLEGIAGVTVTATINASELVTQPVPGAQYGIKTYTATTDANGFYTINVEVNNRTVNATLNVPTEVFVNQTIEDGSQQRVRFERTGSANIGVALNRGQSSTHDFTYNFTPNTLIGKATIKGKVEFRNDLCKGVSPELDSQLNIVPNNTFLIFTWTENSVNREVEIKVNNDGTYEFVTDIRSNTTFTINGRRFRAERKSLDSNNDCVGEDYQFSLTSQTVSVSRNEVEVVDLEFN